MVVLKSELDLKKLLSVKVTVFKKERKKKEIAKR